MASADTVLYEKDGAVARITLNRPEKLNALEDGLLEDMYAAMREADLDEDVRAIVLAGAGPSFCAGHDLGSDDPHREGGGRQALAREMQTELEGPERLFKREQYMYYDQSLWHRDLSTPTIAAVQGWCVAGGLMLVAMCDLIVAADDAKFANPVLRQTNGGAEILVEPWELGPRRAKEFLWTGDPLDATEALSCGLVNRVVPRDDLDAEAMRLANRIALTPRMAVQLTKRTINHAMDCMGQRSSWEYHFMAHQLAHWTHEAAELTREMSRSDLTAREFIKERDARYRAVQEAAS